MASTLRKSARLALLALAGLTAATLLASCDKKADKPAPAAAAAAPAGPLPLGVSTLHLMRAAVEIPADGIWAAESADTLSPNDWLLAEQDAYALTAAASLISTPGIGKNDKAWTANADWQSWAAEVQKTGLQIQDAVQAKDKMKLGAAADHLTDLCQACHDKYRPQTPSDGVARYPFYPKRVPEKK